MLRTLLSGRLVHFLLIHDDPIEFLRLKGLEARFICLRLTLLFRSYERERQHVQRVLARSRLDVRIGDTQKGIRFQRRHVVLKQRRLVDRLVGVLLFHQLSHLLTELESSFLGESQQWLWVRIGLISGSAFVVFCS